MYNIEIHESWLSQVANFSYSIAPHLPELHDEVHEGSGYRGHGGRGSARGRIEQLVDADFVLEARIEELLAQREGAVHHDLGGGGGVQT